ncbi:hypothetical protein SAMN05428975_5589 [Mucilaginibacter sp. OK268]|uniref:hypothetical protein n=1 Tax=Mucilaginibacter sp. OK268 TaxID=1881048 RepID=UPI000882A99F|nr:hypothetical protein [Mucilaginibacter sp. OK268]SDQ00986.1 hypothetical protein SAMN05428975_5589 [Mucilaginibacter sp. OK268]
MENIELSVEKTMVPLKVSVANEMVARYQATRKTLIDESFGINDTRSIWFSIDGIRNFINNLPVDASGVRIHLAAYTQDNEHYPNQTTVIFIGTAEKDGKDTDAMETNVLFDIDLGVLGPFNQGKPCPPVCGFFMDSFVEKTMIPIELSMAKEIIANYNSTRKTLIDETFGINDTRSIWVSLDELKSFINNLPKNANGVRVHLTVYNQSEQHYPNQTTVIWTGTLEQGYQTVDIIDKDGAFLSADKTMAPWTMGKVCS